MEKNQAILAVREYASCAWPVSSLTKDGAVRKAWAESHLPNIGLNLFRELLANEGFTPKQYGGENGPWIIRLPGPSKKLADGAIRCEGF